MNGPVDDFRKCRRADSLGDPGSDLKVIQRIDCDKERLLAPGENRIPWRSGWIGGPVDCNTLANVLLGV